ncbi:Rhodanese-like protein [Serendipita vermifera]|nr:Rhodanese-like protein [Serendipita vermifera]
MASQNTRSSLLLTPRQVQELPPESTKIFDATWFMPNSPRNARSEFTKLRIPGAQYLDLDEVAAPNDLGLKHMMPTPQQFKEACDIFGLSKEDSVILYDSHGIFSSPRALFMFKAFGHPRAYVLNGGLPAWIEEGLPVDETTPSRQDVSQANLTGGRSTTDSGESRTVGAGRGYPVPHMDPGIIRSYEQMFHNASLGGEAAELVLDARPKARFTGDAPEPRPGLPSGHMPNSVSVPFSSLLASRPFTPRSVPTQGSASTASTSANVDHLSATYTTLLEPEELTRVLNGLFLDAKNEKELEGSKLSIEKGEKLVGTELGVGTLDRILRGRQAVVVSCGSGMTAAVIWLALQELKTTRPIALYDESWSGYALRRESPIITAQAS